MTARSKEEMEQRVIDHEVHLSKVRERSQRYAASRESHEVRESGRKDRRWFRGELIAMLAAARTEADLHGLGLSDDLVREVGLGDTLTQAWTRFRPPPPHLTGPGEQGRLASHHP